MKQNSTPTPSASSLDLPASPLRHRSHQLRRSSPGQRGRPRRKGNNNNHPPPPSSSSLIVRIKSSKLLWPAIALGTALVLALIFSAIRTASHTADYYPSLNTNLKRTPVTSSSKPKPHPPPLTAPNSHELDKSKYEGAMEKERGESEGEGIISGMKKTKVGEEELDEAIRSALENTWHLQEQPQRFVSTDDPTRHSSESMDTEILDERRNFAEEGKRDSLSGIGVEGEEGRTQDDTSGQDSHAGERPRSLAELYEELNSLGISVDELNEVMQGAIQGNL